MRLLSTVISFFDSVFFTTQNQFLCTNRIATTFRKKFNNNNFNNNDYENEIYRIITSFYRKG